MNAAAYNLKQTMPAITFPVSDLPVAEDPRVPIQQRASIEALTQHPIEAVELEQPRLISCKDTHPFAQAANDAFYGHFPLTISPDDIWFCIAQGFANHVNLHADKLRHHFVQHEGKKTLTVYRPDFTLGKPNPWPQVFTEFSNQIASHVGESLRNLIVADFSTTNYIHRAATEVVLMETFQPYFDYEVFCGCGIPEITLTGAPDDWRDIRRRAGELAQYGLEEWIGALLPVLDRIEETSRGHHDRDFWNSFFRHHSFSGGGMLTGWIHVLFPYLKNIRNKSGGLVPNPYIADWHESYANDEDLRGPDLGEIPAGLSSAPVRVTDVRSGISHNLRFVAGMFGVAQDLYSKSLAPAFGWAIVHETPLSPPPSNSRKSWFSWGRK